MVQGGKDAQTAEQGDDSSGQYDEFWGGMVYTKTSAQREDAPADEDGEGSYSLPQGPAFADEQAFERVRDSTPTRVHIRATRQHPLIVPPGAGGERGSVHGAFFYRRTPDASGGQHWHRHRP